MQVADMVSFDLRESLIPFSLLKITNAFAKMKPGEVIEIIAAETCICKELERLLPDSGYHIISSHSLDACALGFRFRLKKL